MRRPVSCPADPVALSEVVAAHINWLTSHVEARKIPRVHFASHYLERYDRWRVT